MATKINAKKLLADIKKVDIDAKKYLAQFDKKLAKLDEKFLKFSVQSDVNSLKLAKKLTS